MQYSLDFMHVSLDALRVAWAAGFFDGEGCISIAKPVNKRKTGKVYVTYALQAIIAQRDRRPLEVLVGLFGGNITSVKIHGSTYWYLRKHGVKAVAMLEQLLPFLVLKKEQAELAIRFQKHYDDTRPYRRDIGRSPEQMQTLEMFYEQSKQFNARFKQKDWTEEYFRKENGQLTN
jgi:hypothetical protein